MTQQQEEWVKKFDKQFNLWNYPKGQKGEIHEGHYANKKVKDFISTLLAKREKEQAQNIGMLRQWLNEERIKDVNKFVTNEELKRWLVQDTQKGNI